MKNAFFTAFKFLIALVLIEKILNWFLKFSNETSQVLNIIMFSLIGIAYIAVGYVWNNKLLKTVILTCGVFLITMNFFDDNLILEIVRIVCILTPMLVARFNKVKNGENRLG